MCILLYVKLIQYSGIPQIYGQLEEGSHGICAFLPYVKLIWSSGIPYLYGRFEGGTSALSICAFWYMWNLFGVVVFLQIYGQLEERGGQN